MLPFPAWMDTPWGGAHPPTLLRGSMATMGTLLGCSAFSAVPALVTKGDSRLSVSSPQPKPPRSPAAPGCQLPLVKSSSRAGRGRRLSGKRARRLSRFLLRAKGSAGATPAPPLQQPSRREKPRKAFRGLLSRAAERAVRLRPRPAGWQVATRGRVRNREGEEKVAPPAAPAHLAARPAKLQLGAFPPAVAPVGGEAGGRREPLLRPAHS